MKYLILSIVSIISVFNAFLAADTRQEIELDASNIELLAEGDGTSRGILYNLFHGTMWVSNGESQYAYGQTWIFWECHSQALRWTTCVETHVTAEPYGVNPNDRYNWLGDYAY